MLNQLIIRASPFWGSALSYLRPGQINLDCLPKPTLPNLTCSALLNQSY